MDVVFDQWFETVDCCQEWHLVCKKFCFNNSQKL